MSDREKLIHAAITELAAGMTTVGLYGGDHPRAGIIVDRLAELLQTLLAQESELTFVLLGEELFVQGTPMTRACRQAPSVIRRMRRRGLEHVGFQPGVTASELHAFLVELASPDDVAVQNCAHIQVGKVDLRDRAGGPRRHLGRPGSAASWRRSATASRWSTTACPASRAGPAWRWVTSNGW